MTFTSIISRLLYSSLIKFNTYFNTHRYPHVHGPYKTKHKPRLNEDGNPSCFGCSSLNFHKRQEGVPPLTTHMRVYCNRLAMHQPQWHTKVPIENRFCSASPRSVAHCDPEMLFRTSAIAYRMQSRKGYTPQKVHRRNIGVRGGDPVVALVFVKERRYLGDRAVDGHFIQQLDK